MATHIRVRQGFNSASDQELVALTAAVNSGLTGNKAFPNPPAELAALGAAHDAFVAAIGATATGGTLATADKYNKRAALVVLLRKLSHYIEDNCNNDVAVLISSGFALRNGKGSQSVLDKPTILGVDNGPTTQLVVKVRRVPKTRCYEVRSSVVSTSGAPGPWIGAGLFNNTKSVIVTGQPGTNYAIQVRAIGGLTGNSDWSDPIVHMCT